MSADAIARVETLSEKAAELSQDGCLLSAAEYYGRAAEAAHALGADNLVAASMGMRQGSMIGGYAVAAPAALADPCALAGHSAESIALISRALAVLERRRVAGTLLEGKCSAAEEAWCTAQALRCNPHFTAADAASHAALVGYEEYLRVASYVARVLGRASTYTAECTVEQKHGFAQCVAHAAELMQQPRRYLNDRPLMVEAEFVAMFRTTVALVGADGLDACSSCPQPGSRWSRVACWSCAASSKASNPSRRMCALSTQPCRRA